MTVPRIDVARLVAGEDDPEAAAALDAACRQTGFFGIVGHGVRASLRRRLDAVMREFFSLDEEEKAEIAMARGGRAWRGWFPVGGELTSGVPDRKEGVYFGRELPADDPRVRAGLPLHGPNLFPARPAEMRPVVLAYLDAMTNVASAVLRGLASGLGLDAAWFDRQLTADPTILFRVFRYPPAAAADAPSVATGDWGVAEHTDYGLLTLLLQDDTGGLEVFAGGEWMSVPPEPDALVCNIGDMLERMTAGLYRSTPHRVRSDPHRARLSFPFFFDPGWDADVRPVPGLETARDGGRARWDDVDLHGLRGTYGEYLLAKVAKVFPALGAEVLEPS